MICYACNRLIAVCREAPCFSRQVYRALNRYTNDLGPRTPRMAKKVQADQIKLLGGPTAKELDFEW